MSFVPELGLRGEGVAGGAVEVFGGSHRGTAYPTVASVSSVPALYRSARRGAGRGGSAMRARCAYAPPHQVTGPQVPPSQAPPAHS